MQQRCRVCRELQMQWDHWAEITEMIPVSQAIQLNKYKFIRMKPDKYSTHYTKKQKHNTTRALREHKPMPLPKSGIRIQIFGLIWIWNSGSRCLSDLSQNVVDTLSCRCQSFCQVWYKLVTDCMRKLINVQKSPILQWWRKWKSDLKSTCRSGQYSK